jgi:hypothetical protein
MANNPLSFSALRHFLCAHFSQTAPQQQLASLSGDSISTKDVDKFVDYD